MAEEKTALDLANTLSGEVFGGKYVVTADMLVNERKRDIVQSLLEQLKAIPADAAEQIEKLGGQVHTLKGEKEDIRTRNILDKVELERPVKQIKMMGELLGGKHAEVEILNAEKRELTSRLAAVTAERDEAKAGVVAMAAKYSQMETLEQPLSIQNAYETSLAKKLARDARRIKESPDFPL